MHSGFHFHETVQRHWKPIQSENGIRAGDGELVVSFERETILRHNSTLRAERQACGIGGLAVRQAVNLAAPMAFLKFSREFETEADLLGLQYLWKAGYDPTASIDLFEALESTEHRHPGSVSKLFRTHPLTPDRIEKTQKNIEILLPARSEYVLNTSEYEAVRARLEGLEVAQKAPADSKVPQLRVLAP